MLLCLGQQRTEGKVSWLKGDLLWRLRSCACCPHSPQLTLHCNPPAMSKTLEKEEDLCPHILSRHLLAHPDCMLVSAAELSISMVNTLNRTPRLTSISF